MFRALLCPSSGAVWQFDGLLMMGIIMPETCWAVSVRQSNNILRLIVASSWVFYLNKMCSSDLYTVGFPKEEWGKDMFRKTKVSQTWIKFPDKRLSLLRNHSNCLLLLSTAAAFDLHSPVTKTFSSDTTKPINWDVCISTPTVLFCRCMNVVAHRLFWRASV
jgi:hypothetical protein